MTFDPSIAISAGALVWAIASVLVAGWIARQRATRIEHVALERRVGDLEASREHAPSADQVHGLEVAIERLSGDLRVTTKELEGVGGWLKRVEGVTQRIEEHLLHSGGERP